MTLLALSGSRRAGTGGSPLPQLLTDPVKHAPPVPRAVLRKQAHRGVPGRRRAQSKVPNCRGALADQGPYGNIQSAGKMDCRITR